MTLLFGDTYGVDVSFPDSSAGLSLQFEFVRDNVWSNAFGDMSEGNGGDTSVYLDETCSVNDYVGGLNRIITIPNCGGNYDCLWNKCGFVVPDPCDTPGFACNNQNVCEKFCVNFFDSSTNNPIAWQWLFPGGSPSSSTDQNPANICYNVPGVYNVTLITTTANGTDTLTLSNYITVYSTPPLPTISQVGYTLTSSSATSYQWQFNSVNIPGATNQSYTVLQSGYYTVIVSDSNGCVNSASIKVTISGIDEVSDANVSIYPNPSSGNFIIEFSDGFIAGEVSIDVVNTLSQKVFSSTEKIHNSVFSEGVHSDRKEIDLSNGTAYDVSSGVYFVEIKTQRTFVKKKIIINNQQ